MNVSLFANLNEVEKRNFSHIGSTKCLQIVDSESLFVEKSLGFLLFSVESKTKFSSIKCGNSEKFKTYYYGKQKLQFVKFIGKFARKITVKNDDTININIAIGMSKFMARMYFSESVFRIQNLQKVEKTKI